MNPSAIIASTLFATSLFVGTSSGQCKSSASQTAKACDTMTSAHVSLASMGGSSMDIVDTAVEAGSFKTLATALKSAGLVEALKGDGPFTVFAPTDEAFAKLPKGTVETLLKPENRTLLQTILKYHVVSGRVMAKDVVTLDTAQSLTGQRIDIKTDDKGVMVDNARVLATDVKASNGVIHVIDTVIMPSTNDIIATAAEAGSFKTLAAAIETAGLLSTLQGDGPFTVFAPTDEAFKALPAGTVESLLKPENRHQLQAILKYHVVPGRVYLDDAVEARRLNTVQGSPVRITLADGRVMVNGARVIKSDIDTTNGVVQVIDQVILPAS